MGRLGMKERETVSALLSRRRNGSELSRSEEWSDSIPARIVGFFFLARSSISFSRNKYRSLVESSIASHERDLKMMDFRLNVSICPSFVFECVVFMNRYSRECERHLLLERHKKI